MSGPVPALDLTQYTGAGVRVAVVDSGIDPLAADVGAVAGGVSLSLDAAGPVRRGVCLTDHLGHGTACAGIIRRLAPGVELHAVRIFDEALVADGKLLVAAIGWAVEAGMQVVNLSLGTTDPSLAPDLARVCGRAVEAGVLLVAAEHNDGLESYPAALPGVVGVRAGKVHTRHGYRWLDDSRIECEARGDAQRVTWLGGRQVMLGGSSLAAPRVSAVAALVREALPEASVAEVRAALRDCATAVVSARTPAAARDSGRGDAPPGPRAASFARAALYPFGKEMHAFVRFRDLLPFQIAAVGDPVGCGRTGRDAAGVVALEPMGVPVTPGLGRAVEGCDGLVLGYLDRLGRLRQRDLVRESLELALDRRLHVFSFQALNPERYGPLLEAARQEQLRWRWPAVTAEQARDLLRGDPPGGAVDVPVLAVMGTSASQGKFTLQLALRRELLGRGYELGQVGTEPHGELFGMDCSFPMGYDRTVQLPLELYPEYLDRALRSICWRRRPDLIVAGSQSGTIPFDLHDHRTLSLPSLAFLMGVKPDAVILVVNGVDPHPYIRDTMRAVEAIARAEVVGLAVSDRPKRVHQRHGRTWASPEEPEQGEVQAEVERLRDAFGLPVAVITAARDVSDLADRVIGHFGAAQEEEPCLARTA